MLWYVCSQRKIVNIEKSTHSELRCRAGWCYIREQTVYCFVSNQWYCLRTNQFVNGFDWGLIPLTAPRNEPNRLLFGSGYRMLSQKIAFIWFPVAKISDTIPRYVSFFLGPQEDARHTVVLRFERVLDSGWANKWCVMFFDIFLRRF